MEPFEVAIFGVLFEPGERGCGAVDGMLAEAPRLLEVDEVGALDSLILRVMHLVPAPSHSLGRVRHLPLCVAEPAETRPEDRQWPSPASGMRPAGTCGCRSGCTQPSDCPYRLLSAGTLLFQPAT